MNRQMTLSEVFLVNERDHHDTRAKIAFDFGQVQGAADAEIDRKRKWAPKQSRQTLTLSLARLLPIFVLHNAAIESGVGLVQWRQTIYSRHLR